MSNIPKARKSDITDLSVTPDKWDFYPSVERSTLKSCRFNNLSSSTHIRHSELTDVTVFPEGGKSSYVEHSNLNGCMVSDSYIERSNLENCTVSRVAHLERTSASNTKFIGAANLERNNFQESNVFGKCTVQKSDVKGSTLMDGSHVEKSQLDDAMVHKSRIFKSSLTDCDVAHSKLSKTNFTGMVLKYGIWDDGDLIGRTSREHEVVVMSRAEVKKKQEAIDEETRLRLHETTDTPSPTNASPSQDPRIQTLRIVPQTGLQNGASTSTLASTTSMQVTAQELPGNIPRVATPSTPSSDGYSDTTSLIDDIEGYQMADREKDNPPPPYRP